MRLGLILTRFSLRRPALALAAVALATALLGLGIPGIQRETTLRTFLGAEHPTVLALDRHIERFGGGYPVLIAYSCDDSPCASIFDPGAIAMATQVSQFLATSPGVRSVRSPATSPLLLAAGDDLLVASLMQADGAAGRDRLELAAAAMSDPLWRRALTSRDGRTGAIVVEVSSTRDDVQEQVAQALERALAPLRDEGWVFHLSGELVDFVYSGPELERASQAMVPLMAGVLIVALVFLLRSLPLALAVMTTMGLAFVWTQGAMGWAGIKLNALTTVTPSLVFAIGILDGVHLASHFARSSWQEGALPKPMRRRTLEATAEEIGPACLLTSLTTIGALLAFLASGIAAFGEFALTAAWGVACAFLLTFSVLPILLLQLPARWLGAASSEPTWEGLLEAVLAVIHRRSNAILALSALAGALGLAGVAQVHVEVHPEQIMGESNQVMVWNRWVRSHLRETETLEVALSLPEGEHFTDPGVLQTVEALARWLAAQPGLHEPRSVVDPLRHLNQVLHAGDPRFARVEAVRASNAQLAQLLAMNDPMLLDQWVFAGSDSVTGEPEQVLRIALEAESMPTRTQQALIQRVRQHLDRTLPGSWRYELTGSIPMYLDMMLALEHYQLVCFGLAALAVFVLMIVFLGSARASLIALLPSALPVVAVLGLLGWWGYGLDPGSTMVGTIVIGVAVDDSIHLLARFRSARSQGLPIEEAIDESLRHVGRAVIVSSLVLAAAFWTLTVSSTPSIATFGFLAGVAVLVALVADLFLLPALLLRRTLGDVYPSPTGSSR